MDGGRALVGGLQHVVGFGDGADQGNAQEFLHVLVREHLAFFDALGGVAGDEQVLLDRLAAFDGAAALALQDAQDAVGVAHGGDFRVGDDDGLVGEGEGHHGATLDAGGGIAHYVVEAHVLQILEDLLDTFLGERVLVAGLGGRQDEEVLAVLVLDEGLVQVGLAVEDVDEVIHHAAFAAHDEVEVAQADIEVDDRGLEAAQGEPGSEACTGGGFAHTALAGRYDDDACHDIPLFLNVKGRSVGGERRDFERMEGVRAGKPDLGAAAGDGLRDAPFEGPVDAGDGDQLGTEVGAEDACRVIAPRAGEGAAAQGSVAVDAAVGDDLGAGTHARQEHQIAALGIHLLT